MVFIFGGRNQGKLQYAKQAYGEKLTVSDLKICNLEDALLSDILINIQEAIKSILLSGENPSDYFKRNIERFSGKILIGDEIGCGIVPADAFEREWRDETGWVYQFLVSKASRVDRVWAGIGQTLKQ
jgi:adenosylcobinamide kinase / adenosylcobinamide-phosphate guanylyltransferase